MGELELSVTARSTAVVTASPELETRARLIAAEGVPAAMVCAGVANASTGCVQVLNDFHASFRRAPSTSTTHEMF